MIIEDTGLGIPRTDKVVFLQVTIENAEDDNVFNSFRIPYNAQGLTRGLISSSLSA